MENKNIYVRKLVSAVFITMFLIFLMMKTLNFKIIFLPFILCAISEIGKSVFVIIEKNKWVNIFDKLFVIGFLLFWFGFLIFVDYIALNEEQWLLLIFSLIFWIAGIYLGKKRLIK